MEQSINGQRDIDGTDSERVGYTHAYAITYTNFDTEPNAIWWRECTIGAWQQFAQWYIC
jgi:hypothetical protein